MPAPPRDLTFISYSHKDRGWLDKLLDTLKPLVRSGSVALWADTQIEPGDKWRREIEQALSSARVAVLLVSRDFLASDFIAKHELPALLKKAKAGGLTVLWVHLSACLYEETEIKGYQAAHDISKPLDSLPESEQAKVLVEVARKIRDAVGNKRGDSETSLSQDGSQEAIKGLRPFRHEDAEIFTRLGRQKEADLCAGAIADHEFRFGILSGESGCGKSSFLQAGLWPRIETYRSSHHCVYVKFTNEEPLKTIKYAAAETLGIPAVDLDGLDFLTILKSATQATSKPIVFLFDQFEQFIVHQKYKQDREPFVRTLSDWYRAGKHLPVKIIVCIRGDFVDRLAELQTAMGYSIGPGQNFRLEKFEPKEAASVIKEIAKVDRLPIEERFLESLVNELGGRDDGLISPAYLQIMAWVIKKQTGEFTSKAFQKIGGVEGLLERFLGDTLATRHSDSSKQTVLKVLVALIALDRNARAKLMTVEVLQEKLKETLNTGQVPEAVEWLASADVRLITPQKREDLIEYELAHECLIPAVRKFAGKQLSEADRANQLLDRRVNEWLGNDRHLSFLLSWKEWRLIEHNRPYLVWGPQRTQKENLLCRTQQRWRRFSLAMGGALLLMAGAVVWWLSPWGQVQMVKWDIAKLSKGKDSEVLRILASGLADVGDVKQAEEVAGRIQAFDLKTIALGTVAEAAAQMASATKNLELLKQAKEVAGRIEDSDVKTRALGAVAQAAAQIGDMHQATELVKQAEEVAGRIRRFDQKARALGAVAQAAAQIGDMHQASELVKQAEEVAGRIEPSDEKTWALSAVAETAAQMASATKNLELLKQAEEVAGRIEASDGKARALGAVAQTAAQMASATKNLELLKQAEEVLGRIEPSDEIHLALFGVAEAAAQMASATKNLELLKQAEEVAGRIEDSGWKARALGAVAQAAAQIGDMHQATELVKQAEEVAGRIEPNYLKDWALSAVAETVAQMASATKNLELLKQAEKVLGRIEPTDDIARPLGAAAQAAAQIGHWRLAREYADLNPSHHGRAKALIKILRVWHGKDQKPGVKENYLDE